MSTEQNKPADYTMRDGTPWWKFETMMPPSMDAPILLMNHESGAITPHKDGRYLYDEKDLWTSMPPEAPKTDPSLPASPELPESVRQAIPAIAERAFKAHKQSVGDHWAHEDAICENQAEDFAMQVACELLPLWPTPSPVAGLPTPEVDSEMFHSSPEHGAHATNTPPVVLVVTAEFARSLEQRLAAASAQASDYCQRWIEDGKTTDSLRSDLAAARAEVERLQVQLEPIQSVDSWAALCQERDSLRAQLATAKEEARANLLDAEALEHERDFFRSELAKANAAVEKAQEQIAHDLARENTLLAELADLRGSINVKDRCNLELSEQVRAQEGQITSLRFSLAAANAAVEAKGRLIADQNKLAAERQEWALHTNEIIRGLKAQLTAQQSVPPDDRYASLGKMYDNLVKVCEAKLGVSSLLAEPIEFQVERVLSVPPEARAVEAAEKIRKFQEDVRGGYETYDESVAAIIQRTCFTPGEGVEWASLLRDFNRVCEDTCLLDHKELVEDLNKLLPRTRALLKHAPARPTAAREAVRKAAEELATVRLPSRINLLETRIEHIIAILTKHGLGVSEDTARLEDMLPSEIAVRLGQTLEGYPASEQHTKCSLLITELRKELERYEETRPMTEHEQRMIDAGLARLRDARSKEDKT